MNFSLLLLQFLPLLLYVVVDALVGYRAGILAAIAACAVMLGWNYSLTGEIDKFAAGETALIVLFGWISLKMKSDRYFKFQPAVVALIFAGIFAYFQFALEKPLLLEYMPRMEKLIAAGQDMKNPEVTNFFENLHSPQMQKVLARLSSSMFYLFLAHGLIMAYAAMHMRNGHWFLCRLAIYPGIFLLIVITQLTA